MNNLYRKAILLFGLVMPIVIIGIILIVVLVKSNTTNSLYQRKLAEYKKGKIDEKNARSLSQTVEANTEQLKLWKTLIDDETRGSISNHLNESQSKFKSSDIKKSLHNWINISGGIGANVSQPASQVQISFVGTYRAMQLTMLDFETRLPQLQLDSLVMKPLGQKNLIKFDTTFTLWIK